MKDRVESNVTKTKLIGYEFELRLAVIANQRSGIIGADRKVKEAIHGTACIFHVDDDLARLALLLCGNMRDG